VSKRPGLAYFCARCIESSIESAIMASPDAGIVDALGAAAHERPGKRRITQTASTLSRALIMNFAELIS
jgi:hypothetical protein